MDKTKRMYLIAIIAFLLSSCASLEKIAHQEHAQIYCVGYATVVPLVGEVVKANCVLFWGAPW